MIKSDYTTKHLLCKAILSIEIRIKDVRTALKLHKTEGKLMRPKETGRKKLAPKTAKQGDCETWSAIQGVRLYYKLPVPFLFAVFYKAR